MTQVTYCNLFVQSTYSKCTYSGPSLYAASLTAGRIIVGTLVQRGVG